MAEFRFRARNSKGELVDGTISASDKAGAIAQVERQNLVPIKIQSSDVSKTSSEKKPEKVNALPSPRNEAKTSKAMSTAAKTEISRPVGNEVASQPTKLTLSHSHQHLFTEQLAHLLGAGMTLDESLGILVKRLKHPRLQAVSKSLHQGLVDGRSLSQAMKDFPRIFSPLYVNMVSAGEASGALPMILRRLTGYLSDVKKLRGQVQQALLYPAFLVVVGIALIGVFMSTMVPQLMTFFKGSNAKLPTATRLIIETNNLVVAYWWAIAAGLVAAFALFKMFVRSPAGLLAWDKFKWFVPAFSRIPRYRFYAQFAQTLGTLTENGVTLLRALELLEDIAGNEYVRQKMIEVRANVVDGATLSNALNGLSVVPEMFVDMMGVGEQTGKFSETMTLIAEVYERELDKQVKVVSTLIPPMVMVLIAGVIGTVIYGILVAVFSMTSGLQHGR